ncbi:secretion system protein, partial [Micromonospora sp. 4G55]|nr:secretion system protein [Micromonospora sp. 4G55]
TSRSGAALAGALTRVAGRPAGGPVHRRRGVGRRAGVLIVLPLGLCFLPAFILAGLVPVIVAVLGDVL